MRSRTPAARAQPKIPGRGPQPGLCLLLKQLGISQRHSRQCPTLGFSSLLPPELAATVTLSERPPRLLGSPRPTHLLLQPASVSSVP